MFWFCAALSAAGVLESVICSFLVAEFAGYWLHRLPHGDKLPFLSRGRLAHYLLRYGPPQYGPLHRTHAERYKYCKRLALGDIGPDSKRLESSRERPVNRKRLEIALSRYRLTPPWYSLGSERIGEERLHFND